VDRDEILKHLSSCKEYLKDKYKISDMILFGSYARGDNKKDSDLDIAINTDLSDYFMLYDLKDELQKRFNTKIDIVRIRKRMNPFLKKRILNEGINV